LTTHDTTLMHVPLAQALKDSFV